MEHTKEPWRISEGRYIKQDLTHIGLGDDSGVMIASVPGGATSGPHFVQNPAEVAANGERIVACVNACADIPTYQLSGSGGQANNLGEMIDTLRRQRDQLLEALKAVLAAERTSNRPPETVMQAEAKLDAIRSAVAQAEAAIFSVK